MTVKDVLSIMPDADEVLLNWNGRATYLDKNNLLQMDAYKDYRILHLRPFRNDKGKSICEMEIDSIPAKEGKE